MAALIPADWLPAANPKRTVVHWTAGAYTASALDRRHYHILIEGDGHLVLGAYPISANDSTLDDDGYAAHTRGLNTGSIGVALCAMAGATAEPFRDSPMYPVTAEQWTALTGVLADLCTRYAIPVGRRTLLTHAEVQPTLGVSQAGKWDIRVSPTDTPTRLRGAVEAGDDLRALVNAELARRARRPPAERPDPWPRLTLAAGGSYTIEWDVNAQPPSVLLDLAAGRLTITAAAPIAADHPPAGAPSP